MEELIRELLEEVKGLRRDVQALSGRLEHVFKPLDPSIRKGWDDGGYIFTKED